MRTRLLALLLTWSLLVPQFSAAYFPEDVMLRLPPASVHFDPLPEAVPVLLPPPLPAVQPVAYAWNGQETIARSTFVAAIVRRLYKPSERCFPQLSESDYSLLARDVEKDSPYGIDLCTAMRAGLMRGYSDNTFRPGALVTRAEAAKALAKAFGLAADPTDPAQPWSVPYVSALVDAGVLAVHADMDAPITRAELSAMLWTLREKTGKMR